MMLMFLRNQTKLNKLLVAIVAVAIIDKSKHDARGISYSLFSALAFQPITAAQHQMMQLPHRTLCCRTNQRPRRRNARQQKSMRIIKPHNTLHLSNDDTNGNNKSSGRKNNTDEHWIDITDDDDCGVLLQSSPLNIRSTLDHYNPPGTALEISYIGKIGRSVAESWDTPQSVVNCWLLQQQGMEHLADTFLQHTITGSTLLTDDNLTDESYIAEVFSISNRIQCKKLIMAINRIRKSTKEFPTGTVFDQSSDRGDDEADNYYTFTLGESCKAIRGIELAGKKVLELNNVITDTAATTVEIRSDYGYGKDGYRTKDGTVIVPPFTTIQFDIMVHKVTPP